MSPDQRNVPTVGRIVSAWAVGAAAVTFVVMVGVGVLPHTGTGQFLDPWRGLLDTLREGRTWAATAVAFFAGGVVGIIRVVVMARRRGQ